jgi:hypothetical protein
MITIQLSNASNGVIKKVIDTQYNGVDQSVEIVTIYELNEEDRLEYFLKLMSLLKDVSKDLGLHLGSDYDEAQMNFDLDWGDKYTPTMEEVTDRIKDLQEEIRDLKAYKKILAEDGNN